MNFHLRRHFQLKMWISDRNEFPVYWLWCGFSDLSNLCQTWKKQLLWQFRLRLNPKKNPQILELGIPKVCPARSGKWSCRWRTWFNLVSKGREANELRFFYSDVFHVWQSCSLSLSFHQDVNRNCLPCWSCSHCMFVCKYQDMLQIWRNINKKHCFGLWYTNKPARWWQCQFILKELYVFYEKSLKSLRDNNNNNNNNQQPTTNNQQPTTNNQQPTTNNQQTTTNNQQPTTNKHQTTNNKQQATNNKQQATSNKQQRATTSNNKQQATSNK